MSTVRPVRHVHIVPAHDAQPHHLTDPASTDYESCACGATPECMEGGGLLVMHIPLGYAPSEWTGGWGNFYGETTD